MDNVRLDEIQGLLGDTSNQFTDEELKDSVVEMKNLIELWLDEFEKDIFEGKTLQELLSSIVL